MKTITLFIALLCFNFYHLKAQADKSAINLSVGMPFLISPTSVGKLSSNITYYRNLTKNIDFCVGINYDNIDLPTSSNSFTFDKEYIGIFAGANYQITIVEKLRVYPEITLGYSMVNYSVNEFENKVQKTSGFLLAEGFVLNYKLNTKFGINLRFSGTTLLKKLDANIPSPMTTNYLGIVQNSNNGFIKFGMTLEL